MSDQRKRYFRTVVCSLLLLLFTSVFAVILTAQNQVQAATSSYINFQARLLSSSGAIVADGNYNVEFKLYNAASSSGSSQGSCSGDANCLWTETRTSGNKVRVVSGYLTVNLGSVTALPSIDWSQELWLTMNVGGTGTPGWDGEMSPRLQLTALPYAFQANQALTLAKTSGGNTTTVSITNPTGTRTISFADASGTVAMNTTSSVTGVSAFVQGGVSWGATAILGTADANALNIQTGGTTRLAITSGGAGTYTGGTSGDALTVSNSTSTGNILVLNDNSTAVMTIADGGAATFKNSTDSTAAFLIQRASSGGTIFTADTSTTSGSRNGIVSIGASDTNATLLVVDTKTGSGDPTGTDGAVYYNSNAGKFRCYQNGGWTDCISSAGSGVTTVGTIDTQTPSADGAVISGTSIYLQSASVSNPGLVNTTTQSFVGVKTFTSATTFSGASSGVTFSGVTTDVTTGTNEAFTISPNGSGDVIISADNDTDLQVTGTITDTGSAQTINVTLGNDANADIVAGLKVNVTSANTGDGDTIAGIYIGNAASPDATNSEIGLAIGSGYDSNLYFDDTTARIDVVDGATLIFGDQADNTLARLVDNGTTGSISVQGTGSNSEQFGAAADASGQESTAVGGNTAAAGFQASAFGWLASAGGDNSVALGDHADAGGTASVAVGTGANAGNTAAIAIGNSAVADGVNTIAIGQDATSNGFNDSIALGRGATTQVANSVTFGSDTVNYSTFFLGGGAVSGSAASYDTTLIPTSGTGSNIGGADLIMAGGNSTGSASGGAILFQTAAAGGAGTGSNTLEQRLAIQANGNIVVGVSDTTGTLLVVDTKTGSGDPTGVNGGIYYNSNSSKFRCYEGNSWKDCIGASGSGVTTVGTIDTQTPSADGAVISGTSIYLQSASGSAPGLVNTTTQTFAGVKTFSSLITGTAGATISGAATSINASSNFATNINTGTSTGAVNIGNSAAGAIAIQSASTVGLTGTTSITGLTSGDALTVSNSTSSGNIAVFKDNSTAVLTIADGGAITAANNITVQGGTVTLGTTSQAGSLVVSDGSSSTVTFKSATQVAATNYDITVPAITGNDTICLVTFNNCATNGVTSIGTIDTPTTSADGAHITSGVLYLQSATASVPGLVNTGSQTFAGAKTFNALITGIAGATISGATTSINASSNFDTNINTGTSTGAVAIGNSAAGTITLQSASTIGITGTTTVTGRTTGDALTVSNSTSTGNSLVVKDNSTNVLVVADGGYTTITANGGSGAAATINNGTSTGNILTLQDNGTPVATVADGGAVLFKNSANSTAALQIQNQNSVPLLTADTTNLKLTVPNAGPLNSFQTDATSLPTAVMGAATVYWNGYVYVIGGYTTSVTASTLVQRGKVNASGTLSWTTLTDTPLPVGLGSITYGVANGYIYLLGGSNNAVNVTYNFYYTKINPDGSLAGWKKGPDLPSPIGGTNAVFANGFLYVVGGVDTDVPTGRSAYARVYADGSLGPWITGTSMSNTASANYVITANNYLYSVGGYDTGSTPQNVVQYASIDPVTGAIGAWGIANTFTGSGYSGVVAAAMNGYVYVYGGYGASATRDMSYAAINNDGTLGTFTTVSNALPAARAYGGGFTANGYVYFLAGASSNSPVDAVSSVYYASTQGRTVMAGSLDLVSGGNGTLATPGVGGQLTAGDTTIVGGLNVRDAVNFSGATAIGGTLTVGGATTIRTTANGNGALQVQTQNSETVLSVSTLSQGQNLLANPSVEANLTGWSTLNAGTAISTTTSGVFSGTQAIQRITSTTSNRGINYVYYFKPNTTYTFSIYASMSSGTNSTFQLGTVQNGGAATSCNANSANLSTTVTRYWCTFTTGGTTTAADYVYARRTNTASITMFFDAAQLEYGSTPTPFVDQPYPNLVTNSDFETSTNGWQVRTVGTSPSVVRSDTFSQFGKASLRLITSTTNGNAAIYPFGFEASTRYTLSFWARKDTASTTTVTAGVNVNPASLTTATGDSNCTTNPDVTTVGITTTWAQYYCIFTTGGTVGQYSHLYIKRNATNNDTVYIDGVTLVKGGYPLTYASPATSLQVDPTYGQIALNNTNSGETQPWKQTSALPAARGDDMSVVANGYLYVLGGNDGTNSQDDIYYAKINADGSLGAFTTNATLLPDNIHTAGYTYANGYIYLVGGSNGSRLNTVYYAKPNADGSITGWKSSANTITNANQTPELVSANGYLYLMGGDTGTITGDVFYAKINGDGSIGTWTNSSNDLPAGRAAGSSTVANGYIYYVGGTTNFSDFQTNVWYSAINPVTGANGAFTAATNTLPVGITWLDVTAINGYLYAVGGELSGSGFNTTVYYSKINSDGSVGQWFSSANLLPNFSSSAGLATYGGYIYHLGGYNGSSVSNTAYYTRASNVVSIGGSLDLVGLNSVGLPDIGSQGGTLAAGNTSIWGTLAVQETATFNNGVSINNGDFGIADLLGTDRSTSRIYVGNSVADTTGVLLVLDTKSDSGDPTGTNGAMYYNSNSGKFRCYEGGAWANCIGGTGGSGTVRVSLVPEFPGATLTGDGAANAGTMTSDFCSGSTYKSINTGVCGATQEHNYYSWTSASGDNDYDVYIRYKMPSGYTRTSSQTTIANFFAYGWRTDGTNNAVDVAVFNATNGQCGTTTNVATGTAAWTETQLSSIGTGDADCNAIVADDVITIRVHLTASASEFARLGEIRFDYTGS